ncbi:MAG: dihydroorotate dehydrogenase, partial [Candidatus Aminicenantes bacterium]|nr:dihydroorotate dehydrogenase [Candidatus Aminicenantes bacterium]
MADLTADLGFVKLKNPVIPASGTFGYGGEFLKFFDLDLLGAFVMKGVYTEARMGNEPPRIWETPSGMLNSIGLAGPGVKGLTGI